MCDIVIIEIALKPDGFIPLGFFHANLSSGMYKTSGCAPGMWQQAGKYFLLRGGTVSVAYLVFASPLLFGDIV